MEYLDLYDIEGNLTGESILRTKDKSNVPDGKYVKLVLIFIQNSENKFLFQRTSEVKDHVIATTGGHVQTGQTSKEAIINEVSEELGIDITNENYIYVCSYFRRKAIIDVYYLKKDLDINKLVLQEEEVESVSWLSIDEIDKLIEQGEVRHGNIEGYKKILEYLECA